MLCTLPSGLFSLRAEAQLCSDSAGKIGCSVPRSCKLSFRMGHREAAGQVDSFGYNLVKETQQGNKLEGSASVRSLLKFTKVLRCSVNFLKLKRKVGISEYSRKEGFAIAQQEKQSTAVPWGGPFPSPPPEKGVCRGDSASFIS